MGWKISWPVIMPVMAHPETPIPANTVMMASVRRILCITINL